MNRIPYEGHGRPSELILRYLYGSVVRFRPGETLAHRLLADYELVLIIEGHVIYEVNCESHPVLPGGVILARPGFREHYRWDPASLTRHAYVHFDVEALPDDLPPPDQWPILHPDPDAVAAPMLRHLIQRIAAHPEWPTLSPGLDESRLMECLIRILVRPADDRVSVTQQFPGPVQHAINLMRTVLDEQPHRSLHLRDLATASGVTDKHLCRLFAKSLGHSPMRTYRLLKLQLAMALLGRSNLAIKEIADRCGFDNPLYFSRCFAQTYGSPPREIRRALQRRQPPPSSPLPPEITPRIYW